jgi:hypothetical protein
MGCRILKVNETGNICSVGNLENLDSLAMLLDSKNIRYMQHLLYKALLIFKLPQMEIDTMCIISHHFL